MERGMRGNGASYKKKVDYAPVRTGPKYNKCCVNFACMSTKDTP